MLSFNPINPIDQMGFIFYTKKESGTEIGHSLEFDFVVPPPHGLVEPTQPLRLARQSKDN